MDHVINAINSFLDAYYDCLLEEWKGGKGDYKKLSDCPSYTDCKALVDAIHVLEKAYYGKPKSLSIRDRILYD